MRVDGVLLLLLHTGYLVALALILVACSQQWCARCTDASPKRSVCVLTVNTRKKHGGTAFLSPDLRAAKVADASYAHACQLQEDSCGSRSMQKADRPL